MLKIILILSILYLPQSLVAKNQDKQKKIPNKIIFIGDSLTAGYGVAQEEAFPKLVEKMLIEKGYKVIVINGGISGSTSASCFGRLKWQLKAKPDIVFIALGGNDGLRGIPVESTKKSFSKCLDLAKENNLQVIFAGMKLPYNYGKDYRKKFEGVFAQIQKTYKPVYIPFLLKDVGGVKKLNLPDGIHPNPEGHKIIAQTVVKYLEKLL